MKEQFDYIVIGSGAAGSVLAARLAENRDHRICVLEAGPPDSNPFIHIPAGFMKTMANPRVNWMYETEPSEGTAGRRIRTPRGKTLGGSTSINGHIYSRGQASDYDEWASLGNSGWSYADVLPYFKRSEKRIGEGDDNYRGREGGLIVTDSDWRHPLCEAFMDAASSLGIPRTDDYNAAKQEGVSYTQRAIYRQKRVSAYRAFLKPVADQANIDVRTHCHVTRITLEGRVATGVEYIQNGKRLRLSASREVLLCGGTINSPQLLQLSGIGPGKVLQNIGVKVAHELAGVGENLRDHYAIRMTAGVKGIETINERSHGVKLLAEVGKYYAGKPSILGLPSTVVYAFWHSNPEIRNGDIQVSFMPASYNAGVQNALDDKPGMSVAAWQQKPNSQGYVRCKTANPMDKPEIQPNYLAEESDRKTVFSAMRLAQKILRSEAMVPYYDKQRTPDINIDDESELWDLARQRGTTAFHIMGTCRMGQASDPLAVVDSQLRVHGIERLRVIDASIMPTMPSCNINAPTIMIGEKGAELVKASNKSDG
ncbi:MAG: choline dehydrogenase [Parasphingorhabdus sp.]|jgi:choline dehydrogenase